MKTITLNNKIGHLVIGFLFITVLGYSQSTQVYTSTGSFVVPAGISTVQVEAWGGGGAGGGADGVNSATRAGGGGAGGSFRSSSASVISGSTITVTVGAGGIGVTADDGGAGGTSTFASPTPVTAGGGGGGKKASGSNGPGGTPSAGTYAGGAGASASGGNSGGGGGGAGNLSAGAAPTSTLLAGNGGNGSNAATEGGDGATGRNSSNPGINATGLSAGGSGGRTINTTDRAGGNGFRGQVRVTYTCPTYALTSAATANGPFCASATAVVTLRSNTLPSGTYTVTYNLSGTTSATGNIASMTFTGGASGSGTFTTTALAVGGVTTVTVTNLSSGTTCSNAISTNNTANVSVNSPLPASVAISATSNSICAGTSVTFTATPTNGGTTPTYQWKVNNVNVGTGASYTSSTLADNASVTCVMTSNATPCLTGSPATSAAIVMNVDPLLNAGVAISVSPSATVCAGLPVTFTATPTNGGTTPTYQWKVNNVNAGTGNTFTSSTLTNGNSVTCVMTSNATPCLTGSPVTSSAIVMTINPTPSISVTTPASKILAGIVTLGATASSGTISWFANATGGSALTTGNIYITPFLLATTTYYVETTNGGCTSTPRTPVTATINYPEIDVLGNSTSIVSGDTTPSLGDWTDFGATASVRTFLIKNSASPLLTIGAISITGPNASEFAVTTSPGANVSNGSSTAFGITFSPTGTGTRKATVSIINNDGDENPYTFDIQGTGVEQEINIRGNNVTIADGDTSPTVADWTDFTNVTLTRTYTIQNLGNIPLNISTIAFSGLNYSEFAVTTPPVTPVPAYGNSTFTVTFTPVQTGVRAATLNIASDDADENPYDFTIIGTGVNVDTDGDGVNNSVDIDDDNDGITDAIECGNCLSDPFVNGGFESSSPLLSGSTYNFFPVGSVSGWQATENVIELWSSGFNGVPAASGNQFAELNANVAGTLYQVFCLNGASGTITWSIKHRGRSGIDQAFVKFGSTLASAIASTPIATMVDDTTAWGLYTGTYIIPAGQTQIVLAFQAGYTGSGDVSVGNFIDDVQITINQACVDSDGDGIADIIDLDDDNDGIADIEEAGFKAYSNNTATMYKGSSATWVDANGNGMNDYIDAMVSGGTYVIPNTDGDFMYDHLDLDSDNDSLFDVDEAGVYNGDGDINGDGKGDLLDSDKDGILDLYDNSPIFGTTFRAYAQNSDGTGKADYAQLDSNNDGIFDIKTGLYGSLDANNDGIIDGTGDIDRDGITDTFDTNTAVKGSPRNLDRKLFLDFDGRNDYGQAAGVLGGLSNATIMAWVNLNSGFSGEGVVVGQNRFHIKVNSSRNLEIFMNSSTITYSNVALNTAQWYHVAASIGGGFLKLYLNGAVVLKVAVSSSISPDTSLLTLGRDPLTSAKFFKGKIDEVRAFNVALTDTQLQRMVYQEIQNNGSEVRGTIVPKDIGSLPYANLLRYYRMDAYKDDIVDDLTTPTIDTGSGMKIYNHKNIRVQEAPMPFVTERTGDFATAVNNPAREIRGMDIMDQNWSIVQVKHNIIESSNNTDFAMFVEPSVTIVMNNDNKIQNEWYLKLDGKIDLTGRAQLVQTIDSELDVTSAGFIERDQKGQSNKYNYNYWSSPVGALSTTSNNNAFTVNGILRDGTNPSNIQNITWGSGYDGAPTTPITLSSYWIFKFQNVTPDYANWGSVGPYGTLTVGQGYTLKGSAASTPTQNYTFVGKPNNGPISTPIAPNNANLSGNPYPSALDATEFIKANLDSTTGALYFWEHFATNNSHNLLDYQAGYAVRTIVGGTPPVTAPLVSHNGSSSRIPGRYIPVGQGFFVSGSAGGGAIKFNNSQRVFMKEDNADSNVLFRNQNGPIVGRFDNSDDIAKEDSIARIRVGYNATNGYHRQLLLGFANEHATPGFDPGYDARQLDTNPNEMVFSAGGDKLVIQADGFYNANNIYPLAVKSAVAGNVEITLDGTENFPDTEDILIYDNVTNLSHKIREQPFVVAVPAGETNSRFSLRFKSNAALGTNNFELGNQVIINFTNSDNVINIKNNEMDITVESVSLFNMLGQSISAWDIENEKQDKIEIPVKNVSTGTYIVKVHTTKGDLSKKIIIK